MTYPQQPLYGVPPQSVPPAPGQPAYVPLPPYMPAPPMPAPPMPAPKGRSWLHWAGYPATAVIFLLIGVAAGAGGKTTTTNTAGAQPAATTTVSVVTTVTAPPPAPGTTTKPTPTKPPAPPKPTIADGYQVVVPTDVPAGRYDAHSTSTDCYWEIDKTGTQDVVDLDLGKEGHLVVTLKAGETFSSHDCGEWTKE